MSTSLKSITFIRHAEKQWDNNKGPKDKPAHDPGIVENQDSLFDHIKDNVGNIDLIICSPYLRCRQTASKILEKIGITNIKIDSMFGEFLGWQKFRDVEEETTRYGNLPSPGETIAQLNSRVDLILKKMNAHSYSSSVVDDGDYNFQNCIIVTHGIIVKNAAEKLSKCNFKNNLNRPIPNFGPGQGFTITSNSELKLFL
jgi:broad specificity phosphatase PhoE